MKKNELLEKIEYVVSHPVIKNIILGIFSFTWLCIDVPEVIKEKSIVSFQFVLFCVLFLINLALLCFYAWKENLDKSLLNLFTEYKEAYSLSARRMSSICQNSANGANSIIHGIQKDGVADLNQWNFHKSCQDICSAIYETLCALGVGKDFEIVYDKLIEDSPSSTTIVAIKYCNKDNSVPRVLKRRRDFKTDCYYDSKLFRDNNSHVTILESQERLRNEYFHINSESDRQKYRQYIGIPVFCNESKMIGLIQIACLNNTSFQADKEIIEDIVSRYLYNYRDLCLLLYKMEKGLTAKPRRTVYES